MDIDIEQLDKFLYSFSTYAPKNYGKMIFATISVIVIIICAISAIKKYREQSKVKSPKNQS
jgi:hypothetical protein